MAHGALTYLAITERNNNNNNNLLQTTQPSSNSVEIIDISNGQGTISRIGDLMIPEYLLINLNNRSRENIIKNHNLVINIHGQEKYYPFQLLEYLEASSVISLQTGNVLKIPINYDYFFTNNKCGLPLVSLPYSEIRIYVRGHEFLNDVKLAVKHIFLNTNDRRQLSLTIKQYKIREVGYSQIVSNNAILRYRINCSGYLNGLVLRLNDEMIIENIENIKIILNDTIRQNYTLDIINLYCQHLSNNAIYIPFNLDTDIRSDFTTNSLNTSRIDNFVIEIATNLHQGFNATLYMIQPNTFGVRNGMGGYMYSNILPNEQIIPLRQQAQIIPLRQTQDIIISNWRVENISFDIPSNTICPITLNEINIDNGVCKCVQCNGIFDYQAYKHWISVHVSCPLCRCTHIEHKYYTSNGVLINN